MCCYNAVLDSLGVNVHQVGWTCGDVRASIDILDDYTNTALTTCMADIYDKDGYLDS